MLSSIHTIMICHCNHMKSLCRYLDFGCDQLQTNLSVWETICTGRDERNKGAPAHTNRERERHWSKPVLKGLIVQEKVMRNFTRFTESRELGLC